MALKTHQGSCHCGAVRYDVEIDPDAEALSCNCSICGRTGGLLQFVPESAFTLLQGEDSLSVYNFNKRVIDHLFCKTCGVRPFARGKGPKGPMVAINVRCLEGVDVFAIKAKQFDGRSV
jgi:hypothetical protein